MSRTCGRGRALLRCGLLDGSFKDWAKSGRLGRIGGGVPCVVLLMGGLALGGRMGADMRSGQCMETLSMGPVSNCPAVPSCHFHFALSGPESGNFDTGKGARDEKLGRGGYGEEGLTGKVEEKDSL